MAYEGNQFSYYQNIQLDSDGALLVNVSGGSSSSSKGTHFGFNLNKDLYYNLAITSNPFNTNQFNFFTTPMLLIPFSPKQNLSIEELGIYIYDGGDSIGKIVMYNSLDGLPNSLLLQSDIFSADTNISSFIFNTTYSLIAGETYWIGLAGSGTTSNLGAIEQNYLLPIGRQSITSGSGNNSLVYNISFPDIPSVLTTSGNLYSGFIPEILFKFS